MEGKGKEVTARDFFALFEMMCKNSPDKLRNAGELWRRLWNFDPALIFITERSSRSWAAVFGMQEIRQLRILCRNRTVHFLQNYIRMPGFLADISFC
jgi:hypothetical protein